MDPHLQVVQGPAVVRVRVQVQVPAQAQALVQAQAQAQVQAQGPTVVQAVQEHLVRVALLTRYTAQCPPQVADQEATPVFQAARPTAAQQSRPSPQQSKSSLPSPLAQGALEDPEAYPLGARVPELLRRHQTVPSRPSLAQRLSLFLADLAP